jgi:hypothetical protein
MWISTMPESRRSNQTKRQTVAALLADPAMAKLSDSELARRCGVSQPFVGIVRRRLAGKAEPPPAPPRRPVSYKPIPGSPGRYTPVYGLPETSSAARQAPNTRSTTVRTVRRGGVEYQMTVGNIGRRSQEQSATTTAALRRVLEHCREIIALADRAAAAAAAATPQDGFTSADLVALQRTQAYLGWISEALE